VQQKATQVNAALEELKETKASLEQKRTERAAQAGGDDAVIIDEEEYAIIQKVKSLKDTYKKAHVQLGECNTVESDSQMRGDAAREELVAAFNGWYAENFDGPPDLVVAASAAPTPAAPPYMDNDEQFELLQRQRMVASDPESVAFHKARTEAKQKRRKK